MRVIFSGGGTGGHFYPVMAVAEEVRSLASSRGIESNLYYLAPDPYDPEELKKSDIKFIKIPAGKLRGYFSALNFLDIFKTAGGVFVALWKVFTIYPDVVFSKGGYASFPIVLAARILFIPVIVHESDTVPGAVNKWAGKFAKRVAISFPEAIEYFPEEKTAHTGNPIRQDILTPLKEGAYEKFGLEKEVPVILIMGGSQGAQAINDMVLKSLPKLIEKYQIIHVTGPKNLEGVDFSASALLEESSYKNRYKTFGFLDATGMRMAAGVSELVISRAGSSIFEIASWGLPSIIIPITRSKNDHQRKNAFSYAREGACVVIEEGNLNTNVFLFEIENIMNSEEEKQKMKEGSKKFVKPEAASLIAKEILKISLKHELEPKNQNESAR